MERRTLLARASGALGTILAGGLGLPALFYLLVPGRRAAASALLDAANLSDLHAGEPQEVTLRRTRLDGWKLTSDKTTAWLVRMNEDEVVALAPQCTHLGCAYHYDDKKREFVCPCHTSNFSLDGKVLSGPAPRALDRYLVRIESGRVLVGGLQDAPNPSVQG
jgi:menaquinol-cytochrome c reductase iron-sulfur subunit